MLAYDRNRPIIFLDIDGVLNRCGNLNGTGRMFEPECTWALKWVIEKTNAAIVLSSSWRYYVLDTDEFPSSMTLSGFEFLLRTHGLCPFGVHPVVVGTTAKDLPDNRLDGRLMRCEQIQEWIDRHKPERYVAIDDADLGMEFCEFVKTDGSVGLTIDNAIEVVRLLGVDV